MCVSMKCIIQWVCECGFLQSAGWQSLQRNTYSHVHSFPSLFKKPQSHAHYNHCTLQKHIFTDTPYCTLQKHTLIAVGMIMCVSIECSDGSGHGKTCISVQRKIGTYSDAHTINALKRNTHYSAHCHHCTLQQCIFTGPLLYFTLCRVQDISGHGNVCLQSVGQKSVCECLFLQSAVMAVAM